MTRCPTRNPEPSPSSEILPATSAPGVNGSSGLSWYSPRHRRMSKKLRAAASTSTTTSPGPGEGSSTSSSFRTSLGAPSSLTRQDLIGSLPLLVWVRSLPQRGFGPDGKLPQKPAGEIEEEVRECCGS